MLLVSASVHLATHSSVMGLRIPLVSPTNKLPKKIRKTDTELGTYIGTNCPYAAMPTQNGKNRRTLIAKTKRTAFSCGS